MALLITGAMGHVGFELVRQAADQGRAVVAQYRGTFREHDAQSLKGDVAWVQCDLTAPESVRDLTTARRIEACIHTAAIPNEVYCRPDPLNAVNVNVGAVAALLEQARTQSWQRFLNVSTGSVFQDATDITKPVQENRIPKVANIYSTTKFCGELLTTMYRSQFEVPAANVRISWVYGQPLVPIQRENPRGPIPYFLKCALTGIPIREISGAEFAASYTHVHDVAAGLLAAVDAKALNHDAYHLGSGVNYSTSTVVSAVKAAVPKADIEVGPGTVPWTDHTHMRGPLAGDRLLNDTGWRPVLSLEAGVQSFADWMRAHREIWQ